MKKHLSIILALVLVFAMTVTAGAALITSPATSGGTTITYSVSLGYTVTIPADFNLSTTEETKAVSAANVLLAHGESLTVSMSSGNFDAADKYRVANNGSYIKYSVKVGSSQSELETNGTTILTVSAGTTADSVDLKFSTTAENIAGATKAGAHTDTLTFTVAVN